MTSRLSQLVCSSENVRRQPTEADLEACHWLLIAVSQSAVLTMSEANSAWFSSMGRLHHSCKLFENGKSEILGFGD